MSENLEVVIGGVVLAAALGLWALSVMLRQRRQRQLEAKRAALRSRAKI